MNYDGAGNQISIQDANGFFTSTVYASNPDRPAATIDAMNSYTSMVYDLAGQNLGRQGLAPQTMTYDAASRIVTEILGSTSTVFTYNLAGGISSESEAGAVTGYVYDGENRLLKITNPMLEVTTMVYSGDGLRRSWQAYGGAINTQVWDGGNYLGEIN